MRREFILHLESEMRAGRMTCFEFADNKLWMYFEATKDGPRFAVELWAGGRQSMFKRYHEHYAEALRDFEDTKINNAVAIALAAFDIPRSTLH